MDKEIASYLSLTENDRPPNTPCVELQLSAGPKVTNDSDCHIVITIRRKHDHAAQPCILSWSPHSHGFASSRFVLLRHTANGLQRCDTGDPSAKPSGDDSELLVNGWNQSLWQLGPGDEVRVMATLTKDYRKHLVLGEKYELVWPGGEVALWDWGSTGGYVGRTLKANPVKMCLPGGPRISLEVGTADEQKAESPPPIDSSDLIPNAPKLSVAMVCEGNVALGETVNVQVDVTLDASAKSPITFHTYAFEACSGPREGYRLYRRHGDEWVTCEDDNESGFMIVDDPPVKINVSSDENFAALQPGETWTSSRSLEGKGLGVLPSDTEVGDVFRYRFKGVEVDWWDWGAEEEHLDTFVTLPCFIKGPVLEPRDNGGRPKLMVAASNFVEFTII